jgi:hypothetical protein
MISFAATLVAHFGSRECVLTKRLTWPVTVEFWMGDVIKLRQARKVAERLRQDKRAALNRVLHGRNKAERDLEAARNAKTQRELDQHRLDNGDER